MEESKAGPTWSCGSVSDVSDVSVAAAEDGALMEYETQYFGFTSKSVSDGCYNALHEFTIDCLTAVEQFLKTEVGDKLTEDQLQAARSVLWPALTKAMNKSFDKFEAYIQDNIFCIPETIVLPEDRIQMERPCSKEDDEAVDSQIEALKKKIRCQKYFNAALREELEDIKPTQQQIDGCLGVFTEIENQARLYGVDDLRESLTYLVSTAKKRCQDLELLNT